MEFVCLGRHSGAQGCLRGETVTTRRAEAGTEPKGGTVYTGQETKIAERKKIVNL